MGFRELATGRVIAPTVADLGAGIDGRMGLVKPDGAASVAIPVVFDADHGEWKGESEIFLPMYERIAIGASTPITEISEAANPGDLPRILMANYRQIWAAGLRLEVRVHGHFTAVGGGIGFRVYSVPDGVDGGGTLMYSAANGEVIEAVASPEYCEYGWTMPSIGQIANGAHNDALFIPTYYNDNAGVVSVAEMIQFRLRWTSDLV